MKCCASWCPQSKCSWILVQNLDFLSENVEQFAKHAFCSHLCCVLRQNRLDNSKRLHILNIFSNISSGKMIFSVPHTQCLCGRHRPRWGGAGGAHGFASNSNPISIQWHTHIHKTAILPWPPTGLVSHGSHEASLAPTGNGALSETARVRAPQQPRGWKSRRAGKSSWKKHRWVLSVTEGVETQKVSKLFLAEGL